jgi:hypothetical protein
MGNTFHLRRRGQAGGDDAWKECSVVEERLRFVARLLDGEAMTDVCREFGISRKIGYKIFDRASMKAGPSISTWVAIGMR